MVMVADVYKKGLFYAYVFSNIHRIQILALGKLQYRVKE